MGKLTGNILGGVKCKIADTLASKFTPLFRIIKSGNAELTPRKDFFSRIYLAMTPGSWFCFR